VSLLTQSRGPAEAPIRDDEPAAAYESPPTVGLSKATQRQVLAASLQFVATAVTRKDVDAAYDLVTPQFRQQLDRRQWHTGNIPVIPFPAAELLTWHISYSYANDVGLDLALIAEKGSDTVGKTFTIELKRHGNRWLVDYWAPHGVSGPGNTISLRKAVAEVEPARGRLGARWLLVPLAIFATALALPVAIGLRSWRAGRRALRAYEAERKLDV
jgi:hypothetical protein